MKYVKQMGIILLFSFIGEALHVLLPLPVPASIWGMVLFFLALCLRIVKVESVREVSLFLVEIMPLLFVPAAVGLMESWDIVAPHVVAYVVIMVVTTFLVMTVAGHVTQWGVGRKEKKEDKA